MENEHQVERIDIDLAVGSLIANMHKYRDFNQEYYEKLGFLLFGVNGERAKRMALVGREIVLASRTSYSYATTNEYIDGAFKGNPIPEEVVLRLQSKGEEYLVRQCSPGFISPVNRLEKRLTKREIMKATKAIL